jgi:ferric-dicitrate binding protein FerR (iron transport regulator)
MQCHSVAGQRTENETEQEHERPFRQFANCPGAPRNLALPTQKRRPKAAEAKSWGEQRVAGAGARFGCGGITGGGHAVREFEITGF